MAAILRRQRIGGHAVLGRQRISAPSGPGTITSGWMMWNNGIAHAAVPVTAWVWDAVTGALLVKKTGLTSQLSADGVHYQCAFTDAALSIGSWVWVRWCRTDIGGTYGVNGGELLQVQ